MTPGPTNIEIMRHRLRCFVKVSFTRPVLQRTPPRCTHQINNIVGHSSLSAIPMDQKSSENYLGHLLLRFRRVCRNTECKKTPMTLAAFCKKVGRPTQLQGIGTVTETQVVHSCWTASTFHANPTIAVSSATETPWHFYPSVDNNSTVLRAS